MQGSSLLLEQVHHGFDRFCRVYRGIVQHDCQGFAHMLKQQTPKARKQFSRGVVPKFGAEQSTRAEHGLDDVEPLTPYRCRGVAFTRRSPYDDGDLSTSRSHRRCKALRLVAFNCRYRKLNFDFARLGWHSFDVSTLNIQTLR